ncbi:MAG: hypothetical protein A2Y60_05440 [Chloroflexi bacterium RBG_13_54_9]|nr:MAG: hypothetical protein A2Y60_05440 [Chloroflexi bacterium RBG_13_54_9]
MVVGGTSGNDFLLDSGIIIRHLRGDRRAADLLEHLEDISGIRVSAITLMEIIVGCRTKDEEEEALIFFERVVPLEVDREIAYKAGSLIKRYPAIFGRQVARGAPDALIAATAWNQQLTLLTLNTRQFARASINELSIQVIDQNATDWIDSLSSASNS